MSPKLVGLSGSSSPSSSALSLALPLPVYPSPDPAADTFLCFFFGGRGVAAENLPELFVYGSKAFTCRPGDLERTGDLDPDATPNVPEGFVVTNGDALPEYLLKAEPKLGVNLVVVDGPAGDAEEKVGAGIVGLPKVGFGVPPLKILGPLAEANGEVELAYAKNPD